MIIFYCKECEKELKTRIEHAGRKVQCPSCGHIEPVPVLPVLTEDDAPASVTDDGPFRMSA